MSYTEGRGEERNILLAPVKAGAAVDPHKILKAGTDADEVIHATNQNNFFEGVSGNASENGAATYAEHDPIKMKTHGTVYVKMSGTGSRGDRVTSGAAGVGIKHTSQQGAYILGHAIKDWKDGEIIPVEINKYYIGTYAT
jgi:hypothetical protein